MKAGYVKRAGDMVVKFDMRMEDILQTIVHEGTHSLDIARGAIPLPGTATAAQRAMAELHAFKEAIEFTKANKFVQVGISDLLDLAPPRVAD